MNLKKTEKHTTSETGYWTILELYCLLFLDTQDWMVFKP